MNIAHMNEIMANIKSRRSRRNFLDRNIPDEIIKDIIEAGCYAPSGLNKQPWRFIVITDKDYIKKLSLIVKKIASRIVKLLPVLKFLISSLRDPKTVAAIKKTFSSESDTVFHSAPLLILITSAKNERFASRDCSLASQNMMLYAHSVGISSCFIGRADFLMKSKAAKAMIGLPPHYRIQAALVFGYSPSDKNSMIIPERQKDNIIKWIR